jgi:signal transduction histidine kinase
MDARETQIYNSILIAVTVIAAIFIYFIRSLYLHQKKLLAIQKENATASIETLEKDRTRIAEDLHDELAPMLVAVKMNINTFQLSREKDRDHLHTTNHTLDQLSKMIRSISFNLMPSTLKEKGLIPALNEFVNYINATEKLVIKLTTTDDYGLDEQKTIHLYRAIQELIHNAIKHSQAALVTIFITMENNKLIISYADNGKGFMIKLNEKKSGLGLKSITNRIELLNGRLQIESSPGKGTSVQIEIPYE